MPLLSVPVPRVESPFSKVAVPAGVPPAEVTEAVKVTAVPNVDGFRDEPSEVEVVCCDSTWKGTLLVSVPLGVTTWTLPVVAPAGTSVVIKELETTVNVAAVPLKVTLVAPVRWSPEC